MTRRVLQSISEKHFRQLSRIGKKHNLSVQDVIRIACFDWIRREKGEWTSL